jgi:CcmD family protein
MGDNSIYIVVAVLAIILIGLAVFLFSIDKKLSKLEKEIKDKK